jgi:type I restriction enzyme M protein
MARTGIDEFYETIRLLIAKALWEKANKKETLTYVSAQDILLTNRAIVERFVEGDVSLGSPQEVAEECLRILSPTELAETSYDALHTVFEQMTGKLYKSDKGQYFTPPYVVDFCISVLSPTKGELICDPACGSGAFLKSAHDAVGALTDKNTFFGFDISRRAAKTAALLSYLACEDEISINQLDALAVESKSLLEPDGLSIEEFMRRNTDNFSGFDVIATNPPFAGDVSDATFLSYYETSRLGGLKVERDTLFLERCKDLLKPNGRLAIVLPDNKFSAEKFSPLRKWLIENMQITAVVSLHPNTFRPFTSQKTCVLFAKRSDPVADNIPIHFYRSDKGGKSTNGAPILVDGVIDHDLDVIATDLNGIWNHG